MVWLEAVTWSIPVMYPVEFLSVICNDVCVIAPDVCDETLTWIKRLLLCKPAAHSLVKRAGRWDLLCLVSEDVPLNTSDGCIASRFTPNPFWMISHLSVSDTWADGLEYLNIDLTSVLCSRVGHVVCFLRAFRDLGLEMEVSRCLLESELFLLGFSRQHSISMMGDPHQVHNKPSFKLSSHEEVKCRCPFYFCTWSHHI